MGGQRGEAGSAVGLGVEMGFVIVAGGRKGAQEAGRDECVDQVPQESSAIIVDYSYGRRRRAG